MIVPKTLPPNPLWNFSVKVYQYKVVEENLLQLQNERGLNINILLFCCWYALVDQGRLEKRDLKTILLIIQPWHELIVKPFRRIRQRLKLISQDPWPNLRKKVLEEELFSEQIEQLIIMENYVRKPNTIRSNLQKITDICKNIVNYCQLLNVILDEHDCHCISQVLTTIFSKIDKQVILRYCMENLIGKELQYLKLTAQLPLDL